MFVSEKVNTRKKECVGNVVKGSSKNELSAGKQLTFVCISDTHCKLERAGAGLIPPGDVLLHTGDFTMDGTVREIISFNDFLGALPHTYKVVIAGNHEDCLATDRSQYNNSMLNYYKSKYRVTKLRHLLTNCIYLEDELTEICGIKIYGSPWTPMYSSCDAFSLSSNEKLQRKWDKIPSDVDILMTHGPPRGFIMLLKGRAYSRRLVRLSIHLSVVSCPKYKKKICKDNLFKFHPMVEAVEEECSAQEP